MSKNGIEKKVEAIKAIESGRSIGSVSEEFGIERREMSYVWRLFKKYGETGLKDYCYNWRGQQRLEVLEYMHENGLSYKETGIQFGIGAPSTIRKWEERYLENGIEGLENKKKGRKPRTQKPKLPQTREEELLERIEDLEIENEYLKKLNALVAEREKRERENR